MAQIQKFRDRQGLTKMCCSNVLLVMLAVVFISGCQTYKQIPTTHQAVVAKLSAPDMKDISVRAKEIKHPILRPIEFDDRDGLSPDEAAILAVIVNPHLKVIRDQRDIANAQLLQAGLLPNPQLSYDMEFPTGGETTRTATAFNVGPSWDIGALVARGARIDAARSDVNSVSLEIAWQEWQVAEAAKLHVFRLVVGDKQLAVLEDALAGQKEYRKLIQRGFNLGEKSSIQLSDVNLAVQQAELAVITTRQAQQEERMALNQTLGLFSDSKVNLQQNIAVPYFENLPSRQELLDRIENRRLDLLAFKAGYRSQEAKVRAAVKSQFPRISIGPLVGRDIENVDTIGFGLTIDLPFFDRNQGNIAVERATRKQLFDEYFARLSDAKFEITRILLEIESTLKQIDAVRRYLPGLEKLSKSYKQAAENNTGDYLSYYRALNDLYSVRIELQGLRRKLVDLGVALEISSGRYLSTPNTDAGCQGIPK